MNFGTSADKPAWKQREHLRNVRYGEVLLVKGGLTHLEATVYNTIGLNDCPEELWKTLDTDQIKKEFKAHAAILNGPRYFMMDSNAIDLEHSSEVVSFNGLQMRPLATVRLPIGSLLGGMKRKPYTENTVARTTVYTFRAGLPIYELVSQDGTVYVMQSYAQIVDPTLSENDLPTLGSRLHMPENWQYRMRIPDEDYLLKATEHAYVLQDELQNSYQRITN